AEDHAAGLPETFDHGRVSPVAPGRVQDEALGRGGAVVGGDDVLDAERDPGVVSRGQPRVEGACRGEGRVVEADQVGAEHRVQAVGPLEQLRGYFDTGRLTRVDRC